MNSIVTRTLTALLLLGLAGCRSEQLREDQSELRTALLDLYHEQMMDNLYRTYEGLPVIQVDYTNVTGRVEQSVSGSTGESSTGKNFLTWAFGLEEKISLSLVANPVTNAPHVYTAYLRFVNNRFVQRSADAPKDAHAVIWRRAPDGNGYYYSVSSSHRAQFRALAFETITRRGTEPEPPEYFTVVAVGTGEHDTKSGVLPLQLSQKVPNHSGKIRSVVHEGRVLVELPFIGVGTAGGTTRVLHLVLPPDENDSSTTTVKTLGTAGTSKRSVKINELAKSLAGQSVQLEIPGHRPKRERDQGSLLSDIAKTLEQIRIEQIGDN